MINYYKQDVEVINRWMKMMKKTNKWTLKTKMIQPKTFIVKI